MTHNPLTIAGLRSELGLNGDDFAKAIGLTSRSRVSEIERGGPVSLPVAIKIERLSFGADGLPRIDAASLNADVASARAACVGECVHAPSSPAEDGPSAKNGGGDFSGGVVCPSPSLSPEGERGGLEQAA
jgi:DNA-binding XRE family transcriptional regulator